MARIVWFALGAAAGLAYASQLIDKQRLNLPLDADAMIARAEAEAIAEAQGPKVDLKTKLADMIDEQADRIANMIDEQVMKLTDRLHVTGHDVAAKLRGEKSVSETLGQPGTVMIYSEAFEVPLDMTEDLAFSAESADQSDTGFEANR